MKHARQTGGTFLGLIIGIVIGIGIALAVAAYISKVPVPFVSDRLQSGARQDAADAQRQQQLQNPNATFAGNTQPAAPAEGDASSLTGTPLPPVAGADPLGDLMRDRSGQDVAIAAPADPPPVVPEDPFEYYVQAGAFRTDSEAEAQRARLTMMGWEARVSKVEQAGRVMYRVRVGPFSRRSDAEQIKKSFDQNGIESALVRVQKQQAG